MHKQQKRTSLVEADVEAVVDAVVEAEVAAVVDAVVEAEVAAVVAAEVEALVESDDAGLCLTLAVASLSSPLRFLPPNMSVTVRFGGRERLNNAVAKGPLFMSLRPAKPSCAAKLCSSALL
jgi:hypothetical protein